MTTKDRHDTEILKNIYYRSLKRCNAKLTDEEKAVLNEYNLYRTSGGCIRSSINHEALVVSSMGIKSTMRLYGGKNRRVASISTGISKDVNLADRARKIANRKVGGYYRFTIRGNSHLEEDREKENEILREKYVSLKMNISRLKWSKKRLSELSKEYDAKRAKLLEEINSLNQEQMRMTEYYINDVASYKESIASALRGETA